MREIKFRLWDTEERRWFEPTYRANEGFIEELLIMPSGDLVMRTMNHQYENTMTHESMFPNRFIKVQYTGLHDKNGKEIWEGDVFKDADGYHYTVQYQPDGAYFYGDDGIDDPMLHEFMFKPYVIDVEVIGNIHANPELLEVSQ